MGYFKSPFFGKQGTSTANQELIQPWSIDQNHTIVANSFNFIASQNCTIIINNSDPIPFLANKEFLIDTGINVNHVPIYEFKIVESGIGYWYMGMFKG